LPELRTVNKFGGILTLVFYKRLVHLEVLGEGNPSRKKEVKIEGGERGREIHIGDIDPGGERLFQSTL
jgi:hypothetical protein